MATSWTWRNRTLTVSVVSLVLHACSGDFGPAVPPSTRDSDDAGTSQEPDAQTVNLDAGMLSDAYFINDPAPPMCHEDGGMTAAPPVGGTVDCPDDKNREGCACPKAGMKAACWPGKRQNRNHGVCSDGMTTCTGSDEFDPTWGPCEGYVLPTQGALRGPEACRCFSNGIWALDNLVPCISASPNGTYLYSSHLDPMGALVCVPIDSEPPSAPLDDWTASTLNVGCAGQFQLCFTMKSGNGYKPSAEDCTLMHSCIDIWYGQAGESQVLPKLPGWASSDSQCGQRFVDSGGYAELSVLGRSSECEAVDDGHGKPDVFSRIPYCPPSCRDTPDSDGCKACSVGGSGNF